VRTNKQRDRITDTDDRFTHATTVGVTDLELFKIEVAMSHKLVVIGTISNDLK